MRTAAAVKISWYLKKTQCAIMAAIPIAAVGSYGKHEVGCFTPDSNLPEAGLSTEWKLSSSETMSANDEEGVHLCAEGR